MNIRTITGPVAVPSDAILIVSVPDLEVSATYKATIMASEAIALSSRVHSCANAQEQAIAVHAQTELARYVKAVHAAAEQAKAPLNQIRAKIIALDKELVAKADAEGQRVGALIADFQIAEETRLAALRRLRGAEASKLEAEQDKRLSEANSVAEQDAIRDEFRAELAAQAPPVEPVRAKGQVVKEELEVQVFDIWLLARSMPSCVKIEPILNEIKSLHRAGIKVPGVTVTKKTVAGVRLVRTPEAIAI